MAETTEIRIEVAPGETVSGRWTEPETGAAGWVFIYAPGAGSSLADPFGRFLAQGFAERGIATLRFQFPYMEAGRRRLDRPGVLEAAWRAAIATGRRPGRRLAVGGRSMGGRVASLVVAAGAPADALVLFAYPLHPPGRPHQARTAHLPAIPIPTLCCSGDRDAFGAPAELEAALRSIPHCRLHLLAGADHAFSVLRSSGRTRDDVWGEATATAADWLLGLPA